jgi:hypothetical protein
VCARARVYVCAVTCGAQSFDEFVVALWNYCTLDKSALLLFAFDMCDLDSTGEIGGCQPVPSLANGPVCVCCGLKVGVAVGGDRHAGACVAAGGGGGGIVAVFGAEGGVGDGGGVGP